MILQVVKIYFLLLLNAFYRKNKDFIFMGLLDKKFNFIVKFYEY